ncbi:MAG: hypothetical protein KC777_21570 [Cyanobacteria bacterium HKST-UBA02]|nr:hypothetical protein [Cyanobacteria bacterium HKST-UBA02]
MAGATKELVDKKVIPDCEVETRTKSIPEPVPPPEALPMQGQLGPARTVSEVLKMVSEAQKFDIGRAERLKKYLEFPMEGVYGPGVAGPALDFLK